MVLASPVLGQDVRSDSSLLTVDRIFASEEFRGASAGGMRWLADGTSYLTIERLPQGRDPRDVPQCGAPPRGRGDELSKKRKNSASGESTSVVPASIELR